MKIIRNEMCYVEKEDVLFIGSFPSKVIEEVPVFIESKYVKFENKESLEYWRQKECILDYDVVSCLTDEKLTATITETEEKLEKLCGQWLYATEYYRRNLDKNHEYNQQIKTLKYLLKTLKAYQNNRKQYDTEFSEIIIDKPIKKRLTTNIKKN